jgi:hypothetical protein
MSDHREDPVVSTARREALLVLGVFVAALIYTVGYCYLRGYDRAPESLTFVVGFPDWVFWGILAPWSVCLTFSFWFGRTFMRDTDLGASSDAGDEFMGDEDA